MRYEERLAQHRRLAILRVLAAAQGYAANESLLHDAAADFLPHVTRDQVRTDLAWLAEQGLATTEEIQGLLIAGITKRGLAVASGDTTVPGVKRPSPAD